MAMEPQLKQKSLDAKKLMEKLQTDQDEADKVSVNEKWDQRSSFSVTCSTNTCKCNHGLSVEKSRF